MKGKPEFFDDLPDYTVIVVVNLKTGKILGQMNSHTDLNVSRVLQWVDEANQ